MSGAGVCKSARVIILGVVATSAALSQTATEKTPWKEYVYPDNGFAITLQSDPHPHKSSQMPDGTAYSVSLSNGAGFSLHTMHAASNCEQVALDAQAEIFSKRKADSSAAQSNGFRPVSFKRIDGDGYKAVEFVQQVPNGHMDYERWICASDRLYVLVCSWSPGQQEPKELGRIVKSWRLLAMKK